MDKFEPIVLDPLVVRHGVGTDGEPVLASRKLKVNARQGRRNNTSICRHAGLVDYPCPPRQRRGMLSSGYRKLIGRPAHQESCTRQSRNVATSQALARRRDNGRDENRRHRSEFRESLRPPGSHFHAASVMPISTAGRDYCVTFTAVTVGVTGPDPEALF